MGVKVGRSDDGWEISVLPVELSAKGKEIFQQDKLVCFIILIERQNRLTFIQAIHQMHKDIVFEYPEGVEKLGASPQHASDHSSYHERHPKQPRMLVAIDV